MSEFFRMAAQCDRTVASTAPVELYSCPPVEEEEEEDEAESRYQQRALGGEDQTESAKGQNTDPTGKYRELLDTQHAQSTRKRLLRDANVSRIEAIRDSKLQSRFQAVESRHQAIEEEKKNGGGSSHHASAAEDEISLMKRVKEMEMVKLKNTKNSVAKMRSTFDIDHDKSQQLAALSSVDAGRRALLEDGASQTKMEELTDTTFSEEIAATGEDNSKNTTATMEARGDTRDPFELLRMEERRRLHLYNTTNFDTSGDLRGITEKSLKKKGPSGGIIGMYNEAVLDQTFEADGRPKVDSGASRTAFPSQVQAESEESRTRLAAVADQQKKSTADNQTSLLEDQIILGKKKNAEGGSQQQSSSSTEKKAASLIIPKKVDSLVKEGYGQNRAQQILEQLNRKRAALKDTEMVLLAEEGSEKQHHKRQLEMQDSERQVILTEFVVQDNARSRKQKEELEASKIAAERSQLGYSSFVKPEHPIDVYHRQIREDVLGDRKLEEDEKVYRQTLKRLTM